VAIVGGWMGFLLDFPRSHYDKTSERSEQGYLVGKTGERSEQDYFFEAQFRVVTYRGNKPWQK
jgi:hypothetical protein